MSKEILLIGLKYLGYPSVPYEERNKGNSPEGFDCSGFVQWTLRESGITVANHPGISQTIRYTNEFFDFFGVMVQEGLQREGDLVFESKNGAYPSHIGFYISRQGIRHMLDSVNVSSKDSLAQALERRGDHFLLHSPGRRNSVVEIRNVIKGPIELKGEHTHLYNCNPIGYKRPLGVEEGQRYYRVAP